MKKAIRVKNMGRFSDLRDIAKGRRTNFTGYFPSTKLDRLVVYENLLERDFIALLEDDATIAAYTELPPALTWRDGVDRHETKFSFSYTRARQETLVAVKHSHTVQKYELLELYGFARAYAKKADYHNFELWTENEIRVMPRLANADMRVFQVPHEGDFERFEAVISALRLGGGRMAIRELREKSGLENSAYRAIVKLVARGELIAERADQILDDNAVVKAGKAA